MNHDNPPTTEERIIETMKRLIIAVALALAVVAAVGSIAYAGQTTTGNGGPSGPHYNLNIIGVPKDKTADMTGANGHTIFVPLSGGTKIELTEGDFQVLDANGTDGPAIFQLPAADATNTGTTTYSVYARALGTPGGSSSTQTCFTDTNTDTTWCSIYQMVLVRNGGKSSFTNVTQDLLYVYYVDTSTGKTVRVPLFGSNTDDWYWQYTNDGLKLAQLRFYQVPTTVQ